MITETRTSDGGYMKRETHPGKFILLVSLSIAILASIFSPKEHKKEKEEVDGE